MPSSEPNAGLKISKTYLPEPHPAGPIQHGGISQTERAFSAASTFFSGVMAISASQFIGQPLKLVDPEFYKAYMMWTKQSFAVLITTMTEWWSPTVVRVSGDESMRGQLVLDSKGDLKCNFPNRLVMMANHQLYTDWLYMWWVAYTNNMHGSIYIILKESLRNIPIIGWGCQFYNFIFLSRKWEVDRSSFQQHLQKLNRYTEPMWLLIFPEGTNLSKTTRAKSAAWAEKTGVPDLKHQLLPRATGLRFCLQQLSDTTEWLYDCTIAYEGVPPGMFGQDIFTLRSSMFEGRPPKSVNMYWRRFRIADIPYKNEKAFDIWLRNRWTEKDHILEHFAKHNRFPADKPWERHQSGTKQSLASSTSAFGTVSKVPRNAKFIETQVKSKGLEEFLSIFAPVTALGIVLYLFYGASTDRLPNFPDLSALQSPEAFGKILENVPGNDIPVSADMKKMIMDAASYLGGQQMEARRTDEEIEKEVEHLARTVAKKQAVPRPGLKKRDTGSSSSSGVNLKDLNLTSATGKPIKLANGVVINPKKTQSPVPERGKAQSPVKLANGLVITNTPAESKPVKLANGLTIQPSQPGPSKGVVPAKPKTTGAKLAPLRKNQLQQHNKPGQRATPLKRPPLSVTSTIAHDRAMSSVSVPSTATISTTARRGPPSVASSKVVSPRKLVHRGHLNIDGRGAPARGKAVAKAPVNQAAKK